MNKPLNYLFSLFLFSFFLVSGCGGGGGGVSEQEGVQFNGNESPAVIDATNAQEVGEAAGESIGQASVSDENLPFGIAIDNAVNLEQLNSIAMSVSKLAKLPMGYTEDVSESFCSSGSAIANTDDDPYAETGSFDFTVTFRNCVDGRLIMNGKVAYHDDERSDSYADFSVRYINFSVSVDSSEPVILNMLVACEYGVGCSVNSDFVGNDGVTHRVSNFNITGNADTGYNGTLTFYHGRHGRVSVTATLVTFDSCAGAPDGGSVSFSSTNGSSGTINFESDCGVTGTWSNPSASGSF